MDRSRADTPTPDDHVVEALLERSRPSPDGDWVLAEERRLFSAPSKRRFAVPRLRLAAGFAAAGVAVLLLLALAGTGPLGGGGGEPVKADDECRYVAVIRVERVPVIARGEDGKTTIVYRNERVSRRVKRCK